MKFRTSLVVWASLRSSRPVCWPWSLRRGGQGRYSESSSLKLGWLAFSSASSTCIDRVMPQHSHLIGIGFDRRLEPLPIGGAHFLKADDLERRLAVALAQQRLHLEQRITDVELDGRI